MRLRLLPLGRLDLSGQQQLVRAEPGKQPAGRDMRPLAVQHPRLPAEGQRQDDDLRSRGRLQSVLGFSHAIGPDRMALRPQQRRQDSLPPVPANHAKGLFHAVSPLTPSYALRGDG